MFLSHTRALSYSDRRCCSYGYNRCVWAFLVRWEGSVLGLPTELIHWKIFYRLWSRGSGAERNAKPRAYRLSNPLGFSGSENVSSDVMPVTPCWLWQRRMLLQRERNSVQHDTATATATVVCTEYEYSVSYGVLCYREGSECPLGVALQAVRLAMWA